LLSVSGGTPPDEDKARDLHAKTDPEDITAAAIAAVPFVLAHPESNGNVGVVGFCVGGGVANRMAAEKPELKAVVVYYGPQVPADRVPAIRAPLLLHYAELDERINAGIAAFEAALKASGKRYTGLSRHEKAPRRDLPQMNTKPSRSLPRCALLARRRPADVPAARGGTGEPSVTFLN
ncbi:MAG: dienelactone hydrolase family protein, partial [Rhodoplanes sp.]